MKGRTEAILMLCVNVFAVLAVIAVMELVVMGMSAVLGVTNVKG